MTSEDIQHDVRRIIVMWQEGTLSSDQAMPALAIISGLAERSTESLLIGHVVQLVTEGSLPVSALIQKIDQLGGSR